MAMTLEEIKAKAKHLYDNVDEINTMAEAKQAVRDGASMIFYMADNIQDMSQQDKAAKAQEKK